MGQGGVLPPAFTRGMARMGQGGVYQFTAVYRTKDILSVVSQLWPGFSLAVAGFSSQTVSWGLGMLCQGSMHTNRGIPGLLQMRV